MLLIHFLLLLFSSHTIAGDSISDPTPLVEDFLIKDKAVNYFYIVNSIHITGNKATKPDIILRELPFSVNDSISETDLSQSLNRSKENLLNTSLFNFATIDTVNLDDNRINININVAERWYTWPVPIFEIHERNFNTWWINKDFSRSNYGFYINRDNFRGKKEMLSFKVRMGYAEQYGVSYTIPYINSKKTSGLGFSFSYSRNHEIAYNTIDNKLLYYKNTNKYVRGEFSSEINYTNRQGIYNTHSAELSYSKGFIADTLNYLNKDYYRTNQTSVEYVSIDYLFRRDCRDSKVYPLKGYYLEFEVNKLGLGILKHENLDLLYFSGSLRKYWNISKRIYLASSIKGRISPNYKQPYYAQRALGYKDYVRGYEYYVIDGQNYALMMASLKYELVKPRIQKMPGFPFEKFSTFHYALYIGIFSDIAYVDDRINYRYNSLANSLLFGTGIGVDFVTYYDSVLRFEYAFNKKGEHGFFLHLNAPF